MLCHGSVRADRTAKQGPAIIRVEFPNGALFRSFATDIPVEIH